MYILWLPTLLIKLVHNNYINSGAAKCWNSSRLVFFLGQQFKRQNILKRFTCLSNYSTSPGALRAFLIRSPNIQRDYSGVLSNSYNAFTNLVHQFFPPIFLSLNSLKRKQISYWPKTGFLFSFASWKINHNKFH